MSSLLKSKTAWTGLTILTITILVAMYPWSYSFYKLKSTKPLSDSIKNSIMTSAGKSLASLDVPVGAVLIYDNVVIGTGYNTVVKDTVAAGHAEINAITAALKKNGVNAFHKMDRDKLCLYTTLEPCEMCRGAIIEYRIKKVFFMKAKDMKYWYKERNWEYLYEYHKTQVDGTLLQDSLLQLHPLYHNK